MYSNWIPQNIQKRVFLYILQQLSLFSGIELPNLEQVSYNNIHLRDVAIDPDKISKIPGLRLRHGLLRSVTLKGSVKDGAQLDIAGVELVVAPRIDNLRQDLEDAQASLAQSSADLTSTILLDGSVSPDLSSSILGESSLFSGPGQSRTSVGDQKQADNAANSRDSPDSAPGTAAGTSPVNSPKITAQTPELPRRSSSLGGVMSKAIDIALSKLQVRVTDITVKVVIEPADLTLKIEEMIFHYRDGVKLLSIKGVTVYVGKPFLGSDIRGRTSESSNNVPEHKGAETREKKYRATAHTKASRVSSNSTSSLHIPKQSGASGSGPSSQSESSDEGPESEGVDESDNPDEDVDSDESENGSLMDSMVFTHEEASSIYMSATSQVLNNRSESSPSQEEQPSDLISLMHIDCVDVSFESVSPLENLKIAIHTVNIAATPLCPTISLVLTSLTKLFKLSIHQLKKQQSINKHASKSSAKTPAESDSRPADNKPEGGVGGNILQKFSLKKLEVSLTSALDQQGSFASSEDEVSLIFNNFTMKLKGADVMYGGLETFEIVRYIQGLKSNVFSFRSKPESSLETESASHQAPSVSESSKSIRRADIRFEYSKLTKNHATVASELTILVSKPGFMKIDARVLKCFLDLSSWVSRVREHVNKFAKSLGQFDKLLNPRLTALSGVPSSSVSSQIVVQTASFNIDVKLSETSNLACSILPISYDKDLDKLIIPRVSACLSLEAEEIQILQLSDIRLHFGTAKFDSFQFCATNPVPQKTPLNCSTSVEISNITGSTTFNELVLLQAQVKTFLSSLERAASLDYEKSGFTQRNVPEPSVATQPSLLSSVYLPQNRYRRLNGTRVMFGDGSNPAMGLRLSILLFDFTVTKISDCFGGIDFHFDKLDVFSHSGTYWGQFLSIKINRTSANETLLSHYSQNDVPVIQFQYKGDEKPVLELACRGLLIDYYVNWLNLLNKGKPGNQRASGFEEKPDSQASHGSFKIKTRLTYYDVCFGVVPGRLQSKLCLTCSSGSSEISSTSRHLSLKSSFRDLELLMVDDFSQIKFPKSDVSFHARLLDMGFVDIGCINLAHVGITIDLNSSSIQSTPLNFTEQRVIVDLKINVDRVCINSCSDSVYCLLQTLNDLKEPVIYKDEEKFRVQVNEDFEMPSDIFETMNLSISSHLGQDNVFETDQYQAKQNKKSDNLSNGVEKMNLEDGVFKNIPALQLVESHFTEKEHVSSVSILPLLLSFNAKHIELCLHDGYDWKSTRKSIKSAVRKLEKQLSVSENANSDKNQDVEHQKLCKKETTELNTHSSLSDHNDKDLDNPQADVFLKQTLYQSICIEADAENGASNLVELINAQIGGEDSVSRQSEAHPNVKIDKAFKDLKLKRSRFHKVSAEIQNLSLTVKTFDDKTTLQPTSSLISKNEVVNSIFVQLDTVEIKDNVASSTWNRMLTYLNALGEREAGTNMLELSITNVRPDSRMPFTEVVASLKILPLRLFLDQDTLRFVTRFFGFKDSRFALPVDEIPYVQKLTIEPLRVKFDYKPKSIDYAGIRSGNNAELANFFILDGSDLKLKRAVLYGAHGFTKVGLGLAQIYGPYIQKHQISGLLSGLSPVKSILNVGSGVRDLVSLPIEEYKRDGRFLYGLQKGSLSFAKITTNELLKLGVKLASGAHVVLETSEEYFGGEGASAREPAKRSSGQKKKPIKPPRPNGNKRKDLLQSSQILKDSVRHDSTQFPRPVQYNHSAIDEVDSEPELGHLQSSILVFDDNSEDEENDEYLVEEADRKSTSLYSNQPANAKEGLKSALKAMGKNLKGSKRKIGLLRRELKHADTFQEQVVSVAKNSPVIVIRPLIGGTEAMMKALIGISNGIDSRSLQESHDKYRTSDEQE